MIIGTPDVPVVSQDHEVSPSPDVPALRVHRRRIGPVLVLSPVGDLDVVTAPTFATVATAALWRTRSLVVDLSAVTFVDCCAVGRLVAVTRLAARTGVRVAVAGLPEPVHRLFAVLDLYPVLGGRHDVAGECRLASQHPGVDPDERLPAPTRAGATQPWARP
ncbi:STAS domain-containing protein [Kineococcus sp. SYSU DK001]|uniref:STAS domain-containing protein n=1 Tax=Kineococcus sp. SYSU DK001 TaxID=3383122 RepID=UPI003D7D01D7